MLETMLRAVLGLLLLAPLFAQAQKCPPQPAPFTREEGQELMRTAKDRGFLWRIERNGRRSFLYGSVHANKKEWAFPGARIMSAVQESDVIALELDPLDPAVQKTLSDVEGAGVKPLKLSPEDQKRMSVHAARVCVDRPNFDQQHAMMQLVKIGRAHV